MARPAFVVRWMGGTMDRWLREVIEALSKKYQLIILDNWGMGYTTTNDATFSCKLFADGVIGLLNTDNCDGAIASMKEKHGPPEDVTQTSSNGYWSGLYS